MSEFIHTTHGRHHPVAECSRELCKSSPERSEAIARQVAACGGLCPCGRFVGPRCFPGMGEQFRPPQNCPQR